MIGFMAAFLLITIIYLVMWRIGNKRGEERERQRRQILAEKTNSKIYEDSKGADAISTAAPGY